MGGLKNRKFYILADVITMKKIIRRCERMRSPDQMGDAFIEAEKMYYMYKSDFFPMYSMAGTRPSLSQQYGWTSAYDFTSDLFGARPYHRLQTVEDVIRRGYFAVPKSDPEIAVISDKRHTARLGLDDVIWQIRRRYEVYQQNLYEIELAKCAAINCLFKHEAYHGPADSRVEYSVNKRLDNLYRDERSERVELWQDVSKLKQLLPENAQQYLSAYRKISILEDSKGDKS